MKQAARFHNYHMILQSCFPNELFSFIPKIDLKAVNTIKTSVTCKKMNVSNIIISFLHLIIISC